MKLKTRGEINYGAYTGSVAPTVHMHVDETIIFFCMYNNSAHYTFFSVFYSSLDYKECDPLLGEHRKDCPPHSNCKDSYGSYTCECEIGYENHSTEPNFCVRKGDESTFATSNIAVGFTCSIDLNVHDDNSDFYP